MDREHIDRLLRTGRRPVDLPRLHEIVLALQEASRELRSTPVAGTPDDDASGPR